MCICVVDGVCVCVSCQRVICVFMCLCLSVELGRVICFCAYTRVTMGGNRACAYNPRTPRPEVGESNLIESHGQSIVIVVAIL